MAHLLRGKQAGIQRDLSEGLSPELFGIDDFARCGINSQISAITYDPVQSLLAVGTSDTSFGSGQIYVFGQRRVSVVFSFPRKASAKYIQFCADKLISVDSKNEVCIFSLESKTLVTSYAPPGQPTALATDPSLEYAFIGLSNGETIAYDLDRESLTPFKIPNLWLEQNPRSRFNPVVSLAFSTRDIGKILIGYPEGAVTFSFKQNVKQKVFVYEVPVGAPGGDSEMPAAGVRRPRLTNAIWHPNGIFVLTVHEDTSLVLWDSKDGRKLHARSVDAANVDQAGTSGRPSSVDGFSGPKEPITKVIWCAKENPDDTGLLIAGGKSMADPNKGLTFLDMGPTPNYATSSWQILASYFERPRRVVNIPIPPAAQAVNICLIPRSSPYFAGAHDPIALLVVLSSGELATMSFPSGHAITPTNMLHPFLSFVHPFVNKVTLTPVDRSAWLGLKERRAQGPKFVLGGAEAKNPLKRFENRNILSTAHADGTVRLWDAGHDDEIENGEAIQVDLARAVGRVGNVEVTEMSLASTTGEFSVGLRSGEVVVFRWGNSASIGNEQPPGVNQGPGILTPIKHRVDPGLKTGMLPLTLLNMQQGPVTALKHSQVGFVAAGFEAGSVVIIDLRGPAIIHTAHLSELLKAPKRGSFLKSRTTEETPAEWPTSIEFGVMTLEGEDYSSICCFVGTNRGNMATFKILPASNGTYSATFAGSTAIDDKIIKIIPIDAASGGQAIATPNAVAGLRTSERINGVVVVVTPSSCRVFRPATAKGAHKTWDDYLCDTAAVVKVEGRGYSLVGLFGDGNARAFSLPGLKEIGSARTDYIADMRRLSEACITPSGNVLAWVGPSEVGLFNVWGSGHKLAMSQDRLYDREKAVPARPTITNIQWISGTQYVSPADMDLLIGGPDRPPSKRMIEQMRLEEQQRRQALREGRAAPSEPQGDQEGYLAYMSRQVQERTERLGLAGDSMDRLEENSSNFASDVGKYIQNQKRKAVFGALGSKFGF
ncbi:Lethal giant larvae (Lgl)-like, C-terminal domain-containing protein [Penicillium ucsense]|uniref:Lethal giant larvae (Lgl)-like, C-terminal domain-containing protein n=1 Tax=Penicillium ucsense TaxID=2839758 RepID=A0A8J8WAX6_9EURO|nr:Lethal giant larvae (Lgl)-like, C-terminal domain-containing protein [Penicillium ucsense]KAF7733065.1 Lethal giant larvae (Lgl)-like, C-terminal domain-containing protein [Penicillium ucsense]